MSRLTEAVDHLAEAFDGYVAFDVGPKFTCAEAEALAAVFASEDRIQLANTWLEGHESSEHDDDEDQIHERYPRED